MGADRERGKDLWLDCDPGHDDALAIILACFAANANLLGISTVCGNQSLAKVTDNALRVLEACGRSDVPVVAGAHKPLLRPALLCPEIHGESGLETSADGGVLPPARHGPVQGKAPALMYAAIEASYREHGTPVYLVATGACTNVALLLALYGPELEGKIEKIVIMGGAIGIGNTHPVAEFNFQTDPEAAKMVLDSGFPVTLVPLEVTHTALATPEVLAHLRGTHPTPFLEQVAQLLLFFAGTYKKVFKFEDPPLHDPCAVAYVLAPELFVVERMRVDVEVNSALSAGQTVVDVWHQTGRTPNVDVCLSMQVPEFWSLMVAAVHAAARNVE